MERKRKHERSLVSVPLKTPSLLVANIPSVFFLSSLFFFLILFFRLLLLRLLPSMEPVWPRDAPS